MKQKTNTSITNTERVNVGHTKVSTLREGITLISLVITIIILLILAGVAISLAIDSDGLFAKARKAAEDWNTSVRKEESAIENILQIADEVESTIMPKDWNADAISKIVVQGGRKAPIPKGYAVSQIPGEDKISDGLVIYEGEDPVTGEKDSAEHQTAMKTRNQYVWIPVDNINSMVMCQTHGASKQLDPDTLQCPECGAATKLAGKLYYKLNSSTGSYDFDETKSDQTYTQNSGIREPDTVSFDANKSFELEPFQNLFNEMAKSVTKYKGFYISRYEIQANAASKQGATVLNAETADTWYGLYTTIQNSSTPESTTPQMIWGCQYDQVMLFALEKERKDGTGATFNVKTASDARKRSSNEVSGNNPADLVCNIYDLENNYCEWTAEAFDADCRYCRGGDYEASLSATLRGNADGPFRAHSDRSSRATLYVK